jgi:hypothetical protein
MSHHGRPVFRGVVCRLIMVGRRVAPPPLQNRT